jgi:hypothetical protein
MDQINPDDFSAFGQGETMQVYDVDSRDAYMVNGTNISPDNPASFRVDRFISQTRHEVTTHVDAVIHTLHGESYNYYSAWVLTITHTRSKKGRHGFVL